ncbi:MAG: hypothetical protein LQ346_005860 [Caloplaca aetnensis]|nr:MAG: hypothetical protein LQ346_005860 [Caloplaca aetnensis]
MSASPPSAQSPPAITSTPPPDVLQPLDQAPEKFPGPSISLPTNSTTPQRTIRIGTRASALALAQVDIFTCLLSGLHPSLPTQTIPISVAGDRDKTTDLHTLAQTGKSLWTEEMEVLLLKGQIDCIVHSLKDVPTKVVEGCSVLVVGERGERRDCVVFPRREKTGGEEGEAVVDGSPTPAALQEGEGSTATATETTTTASPNRPSSSSSRPPSKKRKISPFNTTLSSQGEQPETLSSLPPSSIVGTSSIRRSAMIRRRYPHLLIRDVRGNVGTRLRKLDDPANGFNCLILAGAGVQRLGLGERASEWLGPDPALSKEGEKEGQAEAEAEEEAVGKGAMLHAVGQGAIGLEIREGDEWIRGLLAGKEDGARGVVVNRVSWECQAERSLLRTLEGGCSVPVGVFCRWEKDDTSTPASASAPADLKATTTTETHLKSASDTTSADSKLPLDLAMRPGTLHMLASVTSVDGTKFVSASRQQWVGSDEEADEAGWEIARVLVEKGAERILNEITLNREMVERGDGA